MFSTARFSLPTRFRIRIVPAWHRFCLHASRVAGTSRLHCGRNFCCLKTGICKLASESRRAYDAIPDFSLRFLKPRALKRTGGRSAGADFASHGSPILPDSVEAELVASVSGADGGAHPSDMAQLPHRHRALPAYARPEPFLEERLRVACCSAGILSIARLSF